MHCQSRVERGESSVINKAKRPNEKMTSTECVVALTSSGYFVEFSWDLTSLVILPTAFRGFETPDVEVGIFIIVPPP